MCLNSNSNSMINKSNDHNGTSNNDNNNNHNNNLKRKKKNIIIIIIIIVDEGPCDARVPLGVQHGVEGADDGPGRIEIER